MSESYFRICILIWLRRSELKLERQLYRARAADLIQGVEAAALAAASPPVDDGAGGIADSTTDAGTVRLGVCS